MKMKDPGDLVERIQDALIPLTNSRHEDVFERTYQLILLCEVEDFRMLNELSNTSSDGVKVDTSLSFLDAYISQQVDEGHPIYSDEVKEEVMERQKLIPKVKKKELIIVVDEKEPEEINFKMNDLDTRIKNSKKVWLQEDCLEEDKIKRDEESAIVKALKERIKKKRIKKQIESIVGEHVPVAIEKDDIPNIPPPAYSQEEENSREELEENVVTLAC